MFDEAEQVKALAKGKMQLTIHKTPSKLIEKGKKKITTKGGIVKEDGRGRPSFL